MRGLLALPGGMVFILIGLGNLRWGPLRPMWVVPVCIVLLVAAALSIQRYYNDHYGRVTPSRRMQVRYAVASLAIVAALLGGPVVDFTLHLPVSVFAASFALAMLASFAVCVGLRLHHLIVWGALLVAGLTPVWGALSDSVSVAWLPIGVATMAAGVFDHRALARRSGSAGGRNLESSNVGA